jgi:hypothetical protein
MPQWLPASSYPVFTTPSPTIMIVGATVSGPINRSRMVRIPLAIYLSLMKKEVANLTISTLPKIWYSYCTKKRKITSYYIHSVLTIFSICFWA